MNKEEQPKAMNEERFDIVIFAASGFTGERVVARLSHQLGSQSRALKWAVAGRNEQKLKSVLDKLGILGVPILVGDSGDDESLDAICSQAKVLLNCAGPFRFTGPKVVAACVRNKCHYLDISGEPAFMLEMILKHHQEAVQNGVFVVFACGFDSVPADLGWIFTQKEFRKRNEVCSSIDAYLEISDFDDWVMVYTTWIAIIHGIGGLKELHKIRKELKKASFRVDGNGELINASRIGKRPKFQSGAFYNSELKSWCKPFSFADASVVRETQTALGIQQQKPKLQQHQLVQENDSFPFYSAYQTLSSKPSWTQAPLGALFGFLSQYSCGRRFLLATPSLFAPLMGDGRFATGGPSQYQLDNMVIKIKMFAKGYTAGTSPPQEPNVTLTTSVTAPDAGYVATPIILIEAALCLLDELDEIKHSAGVQGGAYMPGFVFGVSSLLDRLNKNGVIFAIEPDASQDIPITSKL